MTDAAQTITASELAQHSTESDCWMVIAGKVYNVTEFLDEHPGGADVLLAEAGKDATGAFEDIGHSDDARSLLDPMWVADLDASSEPVQQSKSISDTRVTQTPLILLIPFIIYVVHRVYSHYQGQLHLPQ